MNSVGLLAQFLHSPPYSFFFFKCISNDDEIFLCNAICPVEWSLFTVSYKWHPCNYKCSLFSPFIFRLALFFIFCHSKFSEIFVS